MGSEVAVRSGAGSVILDVRRGIGPTAAQSYTFSALVTTDDLIEKHREAVAASVRAIVKTQKTLRGNPSLATQVGESLFPAAEAGIIAELVERDLPYYDPSISQDVVASMNEFARNTGLVSGPDSRSIPYEAVVASQFSHLWQE
jgi:ABC-type nitrate/sulfonate/bicarbonate transport system substrate-binding protein